MGMTIKKRLFWSNILMIAVPVVFTALVGVLCIALIWFSLLNGAGVGMEDQEDFSSVSMAVTETVEHCLRRDSGFSTVESLLDSNGLTLKIMANEEQVFAYGTAEQKDAALLLAADMLQNDATVTQDGRCLYMHREEINGTAYTIYLFGTTGSSGSYSAFNPALPTTAHIAAPPCMCNVPIAANIARMKRYFVTPAENGCTTFAGEDRFFDNGSTAIKEFSQCRNGCFHLSVSLAILVFFF